MAKKKQAPRKLLDWQKKRNNRLKLFAKVVRATRKELKANGKPSDYATARKFASQYVYPAFKGESISSVRVDSIREIANSAIVGGITIPKASSKYVDPRTISEDDVTGINWFDIDGFMSGSYQPSLKSARAFTGGKTDLRVNIIAGTYGQTGEFDLSDYSYSGTGLQQIVETIRGDSMYVGTDPYPSWEGYVALRPGATNLTDKDNYQLQIILIEGGRPVVPIPVIGTLPAQRELTVSDVEAERARLIQERELKRKKEEADKKKKRKNAKRPTVKKRVGEEPALPEIDKAKISAMSRGEQVLEINKMKIRELEMIRADLNDGLISKSKYLKQKERIISNFEASLKKMKRGGII